MKRKLIYLVIFLVAFLIIGAFVDPYASRIRPFTSVPAACAENSIGYSMSLHKPYICTNAGYKELLSSVTAAPINATYITQTANASLTGEQALASLATGILKNTTTTGILQIATASDLPSGIAYSQLTLTNSVVSGDIVSLAWSKITSTPSTFSGYGITDTSANLATAISDELGTGKLIFSAGTLNITSGKTFNVSNNLTLTATDGSTLAIGTGGTLGTGAYATIANYATLASPTFTGTVALPTGITINGNTITFPTTTATIARTDSGQTFTGNQIVTGFVKTAGGFGAGGIQLQANGGGYITVLGADNSGATDGVLVGDIGNDFSYMALYAGGQSRLSIASATGIITLNTTNYNTCTALTTTAAVLGCTVSDEREKDNISAFDESALDIIDRINPITFKFKKDTIWFKNREELGFSAQNLLRASPFLASHTGNKNDDLQPEQLAIQAVEMKAIKELKAKVEKQQRDMDELLKVVKKLQEAK